MNPTVTKPNPTKPSSTRPPSTKPHKIVITVAPVRHLDMHMPPGFSNPVDPDVLVREVVDCVAAGASMVHLHVRETSGEQTHDLAVFSRTIDGIRAECDVIIQGSTGGLSTLTLDQRCVSLDEPRVEVASLNMGSINFLNEGVYVNSVPDIRHWARRMLARKVKPELEIFDVSMIHTCRKLAREGLLAEPLYFCFCVGFEGAIPADPRHLAHMVASLPAGSTWGVTHDDMTDFSLLAGALSLGANVLRVGFEDSAHLDPERLAERNVDLVAQLATLIRLCGHEIATPAEAREILSLPVAEARSAARAAG
jgi:3-keto-5-aminohexanoate cleavage enzyme